MKKNSLLSTSAAILGLAACLAPSANAQTWTSNTTGGNWSVSGNWTPATVPTTGNTANLTDAVASRIVTYDAAASGSLGTLNFTQTSGFTNQLTVLRNLSVTNAITLGATGGGTAELQIGDASAATTTYTLTATGGINVNSGGLLLLQNSGATNQNQAIVAGNVTVAGGTLRMSGNVSGAGSSQSYVNNVLAMTSGNITLSDVGSAGGLRLSAGSFNLTGGTVTSGNPSNYLWTTGNNATNTIGSGVTVSGGNLLSVLAVGTGNTWNVDTTGLGQFVFRNTTSLANMTNTLQTSVVGGAASVNSIGFGVSVTNISANKLVLGSNVTTTNVSGQVITETNGSGLNGNDSYILDLNGFTFNGTSSASIWKPNTLTTGTGTTTWAFNSTAAGGILKVFQLDFSSANVTTNIGSGVTLQVTAGGAATVNLSGNGTINAGSTLLYSGNAAIGSPALLTSNRTIGNLNVSSGALKVSGSSITAAGLLTVGSGATLDLSAFGLTANGLTFNNGLMNTPANLTVTGTGANVLKTGASALTLGNTANSYTGTTTLQDGVLNFAGNVPVSTNSALGNASSAIIVGTASSTAGAFIQLFGTTAGTVSRAINATGGTSIASSSANRYRIGADITGGGTLTYDGAISYGSVGGLAQGRDLELTSVQANTTTIFNGLISATTGAGSVIINGSQSGVGAVKLTNAANSFTNTLKVVMGTLLVGGNAPSGGVSVLGNSTGSIGLADGGTPANNWTVASGNLASGDAGNPAILTDGAFTVARDINLANAATFSGGPLPAIVGNGSANSYIIGGNSANASTFTGAVTVTSNTSNKLLRLSQVAGGTVTLSGVINPNADASAVLNVEKVGAGTVVLSGNNTYDGTTTVTAGTLLINGNNSGATGALNVSSGGTLGGNGTLGGALTVALGGTLSIGNSPGTMTFNQNVTLATGSTSMFEINGFTSGLYDLALGGTGSQTANFGGTLNLQFQSGFNTVGSVKIFDFETYAGSFGLVTTGGLADGYTASFNELNGTLSVIPEPTTWGLLAFSLTTVMVLRRRRRE